MHGRTFSRRAVRARLRQQGPLSLRAPLAGLLAGLALALLGGPLTQVASGEPAWTTYHHDAERSGDDTEAPEPASVTQAWQSRNLGAPIWGQPLILGSRVYVATSADMVYALNAQSGEVEWEASAGTPVPSGELPCGDIKPTVGIISTPVIDPVTRVIYIVADTWDGTTAHHLLEGFHLAHGEEAITPVNVDPPGSNPTGLLQRSALNLDKGDVVFGFGGNFGSCTEDLAPIVAVPETGGTAGFWEDHENGEAPAPTTAGGLWATPGPAIDAAGDIFASTANPVPPEGHPATVYDFSDSVLKLSLADDFTSDPQSEPREPAGWFEPSNWEALSNDDKDLGSAGAEPLAGRLLFQAGKDGNGYLIDEARLGAHAPPVYEHEVCDNNGSFGGDSYALSAIFIPCVNGVQALAYNQAARTFTPAWKGPANAFGSPIVSGCLVWDIATGGFKGGGDTLYGLDPATGAPRFTITLPAPVEDHFASPSAAGGQLFVSTGTPTEGTVVAYDLNAGAGGHVCQPVPVPAQSTEPPPVLPGTTTVFPGTRPMIDSPRPQAPPPRLLHRRLHASANGTVRLALRCNSGCRGSVSMAARIAVARRHRKPRTMYVALGTGSFHRAGKGDFAISIRLGPSARARLRAHRNRLAIRLTIVSGGQRSVLEGLLT